MVGVDKGEEVPFHRILRRDLPKVRLDDLAVGGDVQRVGVAGGAPVLLALALEGGVDGSRGALLERGGEGRGCCEQRNEE